MDDFNTSGIVRQLNYQKNVYANKLSADPAGSLIYQAPAKAAAREFQ